MRAALIKMHGIQAGIFEELDNDTYKFEYDAKYSAEPVSLTMPISKKIYLFNEFPCVFEGLLPEGPALEALLRKSKIDKDDFFGQLIAVGMDVVGAMTIEAIK